MNKDLFVRNTKPPSNVDTVVNTIKDLLIRKKLKPGDLIPSENELSESLAISRGSIREAMKILAAFGIIEIRQGDGTYISSSVNKKLFDPLLFSMLVTSPELDELIELRILIECGIVDLIIRYSTDEEIGLLEEAYKIMEAQHQKGVNNEEELLAADLNFHTIMARISHNTLVVNVYSFVMDMFSPTMKPGHGLESHKIIVDSLYQRDVVAAFAAVRGHDATWTALNRDDQSTGEEQ